MRRCWARGMKQVGKKQEERTVECSHMGYVCMCIYIYGRISTDGVTNNIFMQKLPNLYFLVKLQTCYEPDGQNTLSDIGATPTTLPHGKLDFISSCLFS